MSTRTETTLGPGPVPAGRHVLRFEVATLEAARAFEAMARAIQDQHAEGWHVHIKGRPGGGWQLTVEYVHETAPASAPRTLSRCAPSAEDLARGTRLMVEEWQRSAEGPPEARAVAGVGAILKAVAGGDLL